MEMEGRYRETNAIIAWGVERGTSLPYPTHPYPTHT